MQQNLSLSLLWSKPFLTSKPFLWTLFIVNLAGTVYGYEWYWNQLMFTAERYPVWYLFFVPDSPTASLFYTLSLLYLLRESASSKPLSKGATALRGFIEAFGLIASFKYGIWAVTMIMAGTAQGDSMVWQDWMLTASHLGMAAEALLYARFYTFKLTSIALVAILTFWNDFMDYHRKIYPWLSDVLLDDLDVIEKFTIGLSIIGIAIACYFYFIRKRTS